MTGERTICDDGAMVYVPTSVLCDERCHLGEGPTYDIAADTAWRFEIVERRLFEVDLGILRARCGGAWSARA
jgi:sugar lactone lactonase YvrE